MKLSGKLLTTAVDHGIARFMRDPNLSLDRRIWHALTPWSVLR